MNGLIRSYKKRLQREFKRQEDDKELPTTQDTINLQLKKWPNVQNAKEHTSLFNLPSTLSEAGRIFIEGGAGTGKSTFSQHLLRQWVTNDPDFAHYKWAFYIPIKNLLVYLKNNHEIYQVYEHQDDDHQAAARILVEFGLRQHNPSMRSIEIQSMCKDIANDRILYIFDGYNEACFSDDYLLFEPIINRLFSYKNVIVTSRPAIRKIKMDISVAQYILDGFNDKDMHQFIWNFFRDHPERKVITENLREYLKKNSSLRKIAHVPITLSIVCQIWQKQPLQSDLTSISALYQKILIRHLKILLEKYNKINASGLSDVATLINKQSSLVLRILEETAYSTISENQENNNLIHSHMRPFTNTSLLVTL